MSRSRTSSSSGTGSILDQRGSKKPTQNNTSSHRPRSTTSATDEANAGAHSLAEPPERGASKTQHDDAAAHRQADHTTSPQARARLQKKFKRLEPPARSDASMPHAHMDQAEEDHGTGAELHDTAKPARTPLHALGQSKEAAKKSPRIARSSSNARKAVWCGNNKLDKRLKVNGGHMEVGSPHACFQRGVGAGIHQDIPPGEEDEFVDKWLGQRYEKLVEQPIWYKSTPPPHGMFRCTLPQAMARGFAVGSKKRAEILKRRGHTTHGT